jgi:hypothetical protein
LSRNRVVVPARQPTQLGGIGSLESILVLLKSLKIRALQDKKQGAKPIPATTKGRSYLFLLYHKALEICALFYTLP